jgi:hypothetical protein
MFLANRVRSSTSEERKLQRGAIAGAASAFSVSNSTVDKIWRKNKNGITKPEHHKLDLRRKKGSGRPSTLSVDQVKARVKAVPFSLRKSLRALSPHVGIPRTTLHRYLSRGVLAKSGSAVKPMLTDANKVARVDYCKGFVDAEGCFEEMLDRVDIDEKWWLLTEKSCSYIVVPGEELPPSRFVKHKSHIIKAMCLCASARPRQNPETGDWWDGKIGMWFFVEYVAAKRGSKNRPAGTIETKPVNVDKKVFVQMVVDDLLPAIEEKWPAWARKKISIQLDNAPAHQKSNTNLQISAKLEEMAARGWTIDFVLQPPNSPDTNIKDLALFRAMQSLQYTKPSKNIDELIANATQAFLEYPLDFCKKVWTTAQMVMNEIIRCEGGNTYKLPHAQKDAIVRSQKRDIPLRLPCQAMHTGGAINGAVIRAYMEGGLAASNQVAPAPQVMVSGKISTACVVPASWPAVISPTRPRVANETDGVWSNFVDDDFWDNFAERIEWGGEEYEHDGVELAAA